MPLATDRLAGAIRPSPVRSPARTVDAQVGKLARRQGPDRLPARLDTARPWRVSVWTSLFHTRGAAGTRGTVRVYGGGSAPPPGRTPFESPARHAGEGERRRYRPAGCPSSTRSATPALTVDAWAGKLARRPPRGRHVERPAASALVSFDADRGLVPGSIRRGAGRDADEGETPGPVRSGSTSIRKRWQARALVARVNHVERPAASSSTRPAPPSAFGFDAAVP